MWQTLVAMTVSIVSQDGDERGSVTKTCVRGGNSLDIQVDPEDMSNSSLAMADNTNELIQCVRAGDDVRLKALLDAGVDVKGVTLPEDDPETAGYTLLGLAAMCGHHHLIVPLLTAGVLVNDPGGSTRSPLHLATLYGHENCAEALLEASADIEAASEKDCGERPLHFACRTDNLALIRLLLARGADIHSTDEEGGFGALHFAAYYDQPEIAKLLIDKGVDIEASSLEKWRPIHRAALRDNTRVIEVLLDAGADINAPGSFGNRAVHFAATRGQIATLKILAERNCDLCGLENLGGNAVMSAASGGRLQTVQWLVQQNVPHLHRNNANRTPEAVARMYGYHHVAWWLHKLDGDDTYTEHTDIAVCLEEYERIGNITLRWAKVGLFSSIRLNLPARPYRVHYQDENGWTPLHHASYNNMKEAVLALLWVGAYPLSLTMAKETPRDLALSQGHPQIAKLLEVTIPELSRKQRVYLYGRLLHKISCAELQTLHEAGELVEQGRRVTLVKEVGELLQSGAPLEPVGGHTVHALHLAITTNCTDLLPLLLSVRVPLTATTGGMNVIQLAWISPDVTTQIGVIVTRAFIQKMQQELTLVGEEYQDLRAGMEQMVEQLQDEEPWRAAWQGTEKTTEVLTNLLSQACHHGASLTASFIQWEGGSATSQAGIGRTALHVALDAGHLTTAVCLVRNLGGNLFLGDSEGRLPLHMCPQSTRVLLLEDAVSHDYRALDFVLGKARTTVEKKNTALIMLLLATLYTEANLSSEEAISQKVKLSSGAPQERRDPCPSESWKEVFLQLAAILHQVEESEFLDNGWLKYLSSCITESSGEQDGVAEGESEGAVGDEGHTLPDIEEELFFSLIEDLNTRGKVESKNRKRDAQEEDLLNTTLHRTLRLCCESGLPLLTHLVLTVGGVNVDEVVDAVSGSTSLHIVASHGRLGLLDYLLSRRASTSVVNGAGHTPAHLAYMFGHTAVGDRLCEGLEEARDRAGKCPKDLLAGFKKYMEIYILDKKIRVKAHELNDPLALTRAHLEQFKWKWRANFKKAVKKLHVDFTRGEAKVVQETLAVELRRLLQDLAKLNPLLDGDLQILGSSADNLRLYAPDEFDCNVVLKTVTGFPGGGLNVELKPLDKKLASMKGYTTYFSVTPVDDGDQKKFDDLKEFVEGPNFVNTFSEALFQCLQNFKLSDPRLNFVPPGARKTQVGTNVSFVWEGTEYPMLLIDVDMVPILKIPWPKDQDRPPLTPADVDTLYLSNTGDGDWRFSFSAIENKIFSALTDDQRLVFLSCKLMIVSLKVESWAPRDRKELFTYWYGRRFKLPAPAGFILKNTFMMELEEVKDAALWDPSHLHERMRSIFCRMCKTDTNEKTGENRYFHGKVRAYFGGNAEKPSVGLGAPEILRALELWESKSEGKMNTEPSAPEIQLATK
ncbi:uncharacterized protein LOC121862540 isoform X2 [Homarus americanus]|uniref:uncharacterized protein LOC121862540 isoform X2 n=1 Tax=Homarus americanus TaxID=6706 RepID=UPI001C48D99C|nr:uncharacterized protein LOC121862540 isoform X2 [Homarus americanus]